MNGSDNGMVSATESFQKYKSDSHFSHRLGQEPAACVLEQLTPSTSFVSYLDCCPCGAVQLFGIPWERLNKCRVKAILYQ